MESTVRYTGQAVGYVEQEVTPRITGVITWMPFYTGDRVKRGQLLARLDTSQAAPQVAAQQGQLAMARQGVGVSEKDYQQALAMIGEAHAELGMKTGALEAARADVSAAEQERNSAQANLEAAQTMTADATAQIQAAQADAQYWQDEMTREQSLLKAGAVTREEFQREQAQAQNAEAKVREARAHAAQVEAQVRAAQSGIPKASAMIAAAQARLQQAQSDLHAHEAHVRSASAAADSARQKIAQAQTGVQAARGVLAGASATQGYSEIRSETDGVITQRMISPGVLVSPGQVILRVARISPIRLQANVTESDLQKLRVGSRVLVSNQDASTPPITTRLTSIAPSIDPTARTGVAEALVSNTAGHFVPGQYVTMEISTGQGTNTLRIPTRALRYHTAPSGNALSTASTPTVWVAEAVGGADNQYTVHEVTVQTGMSDARSTEILSGLQAGQTVVTNGQDYLKDSDTVSPAKVQDMQTASASGAGDAVAPGIHRAGNPATHSPGGAHTLYTCLMHPEIVRDHPGACPKCGMALVPKSAGGTR